MIFVVFTTFIALFLMNLLIAILSDAYELVTSEKKYYNGRALLHRSLSYERLVTFAMKLINGEREQTYHYLFASMPVGFLDDTCTEEEGMIGKILYAARVSHQEICDKFDQFEKRSDEIDKRFDQIQEETKT